MLPILFNRASFELLEAENQEKKFKKNCLGKKRCLLKMPFLLTLTLEKSKFIPSSEAFFRQDSGCAILFEMSELKHVQK